MYPSCEGGWGQSYRGSAGPEAGQGAYRILHRLIGNMLHCGAYIETYQTRENKMRFISYSTESGPRLGSVQGDLVQPITGMDMLGLIEAGPAGLDQARAAQGD